MYPYTYIYILIYIHTYIHYNKTDNKYLMTGVQYYSSENRALCKELFELLLMSFSSTSGDKIWSSLECDEVASYIATVTYQLTV